MISPQSGAEKPENSKEVGRRAALRTFAVAGTALGLGVGSCTDPAPAARFPQGVASGDPTQSALVIWTRVVAPAAAFVTGIWEVAEDASFVRLLASGAFATGPEHDFTVKVDVTDLPAGTRLAYRFKAGNAVSPIGHGMTLPEGKADRLRLALFSCSDYGAGYFNAYRHCAGRDDVDLVMHVGDYIYEYAGSAGGPAGRRLEPTHDLTSLADYRARYAHYRTDPDLQELHRKISFITVWDDHESANDSWTDGAENQHPGQLPWPQRRANAVRAYFEWMPIRPLAADTAQRSYRAFRYGDLASLMMLDTRLYGRDRPLSYGGDLLTEEEDPQGERTPDWAGFRARLMDPARSILGAEQEAWLETELKHAQAQGVRWRLLGQQTLMGLMSPVDPTPLLRPGVTLDGEQQAAATFQAALAREAMPIYLDSFGGSYRAARARLLDAITAHGGNAVILSGDSHNAWAFNLKDNSGRIAAVEIGGTSVTSSGLECELPVDTAAAERAMQAANPELAYCQLSARGYAVVGVTPAAVTVEFVFLDTVRARDFKAVVGRRFTVPHTEGPATAAFIGV